MTKAPVADSAFSVAGIREVASDASERLLLLLLLLLIALSAFPK
jgi:hypothetical protein